MEKIRAREHSAILVINDKIEVSDCVSEIGRYGICFADNGKVGRSQDTGYLVRTKVRDIDEGGVSSGYACLNSMKLENN